MKKTLAFLLALVLIGTSGVFSTLHVSAAENKEAKEPQVVSKTDTSITLQTQENLEYALQVKNEKTDTLIWKWATDAQYNHEKQTVIFQDLKADTDYKFTYREKNSQEETELPVFTIRTDVQKEQENITTPDNTKPQENNTTPDKTKPQEDNTAPDNTKPQENNTAPDNTKSQGETPPSTDNTNKLQMATPHSDSHVDSPTDEKPEGINTPPMDIQPPKDTTPKPVNAPDAPTAASVTDTEIILNTEEKQEYAMIQDEKDLVWQASGIFKDLKPSTDYSFVTRIKTDTEISENSKPLKVTTKSSAAKAPATPELSKKTDTRIQIHSVTGQEYSLLKDGKPISWNTSGNFENLSPETEYQIVTRIIFNDEEAMPSEISKPLIITTKSIAAQAPEAPKLSGRSETSITLQAQKSLEYAISTDGTTWKWQSGNVFSGLKENTSYQFIARKAFDSDKAMPSKESPAITYKTYMAFQGTIEGIKANGTYYRDTKLTATAVGTGMNQTSPGNWDSRWVPKTWTWDGKNYSSWKSAPYDVTFVLDKVGDYCLTVGYELEEHTSGSWKGTGLTKTSSVSFKAVVPVYTIQASSDKYGKISPSGTIEVKEGSSTEFTFTPNKDYKVSKVFVNGKQVTIKNNKYTISNVKANQTISVSFERIDGRQIPKTGDESQIFLYTVLFVSATAIFLLVIRANGKRITIKHFFPRKINL